VTCSVTGSSCTEDMSAMVNSAGRRVGGVDVSRVWKREWYWRRGAFGVSEKIFSAMGVGDGVLVLCENIDPLRSFVGVYANLENFFCVFLQQFVILLGGGDRRMRNLLFLRIRRKRRSTDRNVFGR
jgi:hypothetical protein